MDPEYENAILRLVALAAHRNGGTLVETQADRDEMEATYGEPLPATVSADENGVAVVIGRLEDGEFVDRLTPVLAASGTMSVDAARAQAEAVAATFKARKALMADAAARGEDPYEQRDPITRLFDAIQRASDQRRRDSEN
jgi:hypothetical protein